MEKNVFSEYPEIAKEWDYSKNIKGPEEYAPHSNKTVWWICPIGHSYKRTIDKRTGCSQGCPFCSGKRVLSGFNDLKTKEPELVKEWDFVNNDITPDQVTPGSHKRVNWICHICGNRWQAVINDRTSVKGRDCPVCAKEKRVKSYLETRLKPGINDFVSQCPELINEWDYEKNQISPEKITIGTNNKVWWLCHTCGNSWKASIHNRVTNKSGCPVCSRHKSTSFPEQAIYYYISKVFPNTQNGYKDIFPTQKMEIDIFIPELMIGIEYDGIYWHSNENSSRKAKEKYQICRNNHIKLIRVSEIDMEMDNTSDIFIYRKEITDDGLNKCIEELLSKIVSKYGLSVDVNRDRAEIMSLYITVLREKSITIQYPDAVWEWDLDKNNGLSPDMVNANSQVTYWWKCKLGHSYKSTPANKLPYGYGCPICSGHKLLTGFNDLQTKEPTIAAEWDYERNDPLIPSKVYFRAQRKAWWICPKGHSYQAKITSRTVNKTRCPICYGTATLEGYNDFFTTHPAMKLFWDYERNKNIEPTTLRVGSTKRVWWKCEKGHSWKKTVASQIETIKCPICNYRVLVPYVNDLSVSDPEIASEWDYEKNLELTPHDVIRRSTKKVWWKCKDCGTEWESRINMRVRGSGCPSCGYSKRMQSTRRSTVISNKQTLKDRFPEIAREWDFSKNEGLKPDSVSYGANLKVWWICPQGHSYQAWVTDRIGKRKTGCPQCSYLAKAKKVICVETGEIYDSPRLAAESVNKQPTTIHRAARDQTKTCGGYHWRYIEQ